jgi:hypothetical protein
MLRYTSNCEIVAGNSRAAHFKQLAVVTCLDRDSKLPAAVQPCHDRHHGDDRPPLGVIERHFHVGLLAELDQVARGRKRQLEPPALAARGDSQIESVDSLPSCAPTCSGGAAARKNQVSNRFGMPSGVIQCA